MNQIFDPFNKWFADLDEVEMVAIEQERRKNARQSTYLHCWCVGNADYDLMWKAYIKDPPGVPIKSSVKRLIKLCDDAMSHWRLDITMVTFSIMQVVKELIISENQRLSSIRIAILN